MSAISDRALLTDTGLSVRDLRGARSGPFTLSVPRGTATVVTGPSGSGKSLFLRLIADLDPGTGDLSLDGRERASMTGAEWRAQVTYLAAEPAWWAPDIASHFLHPDRVDVAALGLTPQHVTGLVARLSTGERQRLVLLRALDRAPQCLLLDEPTASLDPEAKSLTEILLRRLMENGMPLLVVTHDAAQAARLGARAIWRMTDGTLA